MERKRPQRVSDVHGRRWLLHRRRQLKNTACNFKCISSRGKTLLSAGAASHLSSFVSKNFNALCVLDNGKALDISQLSSLIKDSSFVIANDTGPAHMAAHLGAKGLTLFGSHTTAYKVSIEREKFKAIQVNDLAKLSTDKVLEKINLN